MYIPRRGDINAALSTRKFQSRIRIIRAGKGGIAGQKKKPKPVQLETTTRCEIAPGDTPEPTAMMQQYYAEKLKPRELWAMARERYAVRLEWEVFGRDVWTDPKVENPDTSRTAYWRGYREQVRRLEKTAAEYASAGCDPKRCQKINWMATKWSRSVPSWAAPRKCGGKHDITFKMYTGKRDAAFARNCPSPYKGGAYNRYRSRLETEKFLAVMGAEDLVGETHPHYRVYFRPATPEILPAWNGDVADWSPRRALTCSQTFGGRDVTAEVETALEAAGVIGACRCGARTPRACLRSLTRCLHAFPLCAD